MLGLFSERNSSYVRPQLSLTKWINVQPECRSQTQRKLRMGGQPQSATVHKTCISPMLSVRNWAKAIELYRRVWSDRAVPRRGREWWSPDVPIFHSHER